MHIDKQVMLSILVMLFSSRGTETDKVEGLWLINRPECLVPEYPDNSPKVWMCSPFIVPSLDSMKNPHDVTSWCHDHLLWSSSRKTTVHVHVHWNGHGSSAHQPASVLKPQILKKLQTSSSLSWPSFRACDIYIYCSPLLQWYSGSSTDRNSFTDTPLDNNCQPMPNTL